MTVFTKEKKEKSLYKTGCVVISVLLVVAALIISLLDNLPNSTNAVLGLAWVILGFIFVCKYKSRITIFIVGLLFSIGVFCVGSLFESNLDSDDPKSVVSKIHKQYGECANLKAFGDELISSLVKGCQISLEEGKKVAKALKEAAGTMTGSPTTGMDSVTQYIVFSIAEIWLFIAWSLFCRWYRPSEFVSF